MLVKKEKHTKNKTLKDSGCFIYLQKSAYAKIGSLNVNASRLLGVGCKKANILHDSEDKTIYIIADKNGEYSIMKSRNSLRVCLHGLVNELGIKTGVRYDVEKIDGGIKFRYEVNEDGGQANVLEKVDK